MTTYRRLHSRNPWGALSPDGDTHGDRLDAMDGSACWDDDEPFDDGDLTRCECVTGCEPD